MAYYLTIEIINLTVKENYVYNLERIDMKLSVIIPAYNEEGFIGECIASVLRLNPYEIIVVDGDSIDNTVNIARSCGAKVLHAGRGRGVQIAAGVEAAGGDTVLMMHADTLLSEEVVSDDFELTEEFVAGFFRLKFRTNAFLVKVVEFFANIRARIHSLPYGDQAVFVKRKQLMLAGGVKEYPFLEDVELMLRLKKVGKIKYVPKKVLVSDRKLVGGGFFHPITHSIKNVFIVLCFLAGVPPQKLLNFYKEEEFYGSGKGCL